MHALTPPALGWVVLLALAAHVARYAPGYLFRSYKPVAPWAAWRPERLGWSLNGCPQMAAESAFFAAPHQQKMSAQMAFGGVCVVGA